ncbi:lysozyme [uncultured Clostridium sp.]|uniref:lysozyme n=1 Tax=uncultured Clostridium sp. TaxID=59620 RepID=UPI0025DAD0F2|nr:lysozyme [uncultured Clostridium sp.]
MKKLKILTLVLSLLMLQGIGANAASSSKKDDFDKEEIENRLPGFGAYDIAKSDQYVKSGKNTFSAKKAISMDDDDQEDNVISEYKYDQVGPISATDIVSMMAIEGTNAQWGRASDGKWIYLENNAPGIGWKMVKGYWYYMDGNGIMQTGWVNYKGSWYYLYSNGQMARNTWINGYYVGDSGAMVS